MTDQSASTGEHRDQNMVVLREPWPQVRGRPGLTQGAYGQAGNLELAACGTDDGLWVGWFNSDPVETRIGALVGRWSGALRFGSGHSYRAVDITQVRPGPRWLEAVALTTRGGLRRLVWSPEDGFVDQGEICQAVGATSGVIESPSGQFLVAIVADGRPRLLSATPGSGYPALSWTAEHLNSDGDTDVTDVDGAWHDDHLDLVVVHRDGTVRHRCRTTAGGWDVVTNGAACARLAAAGSTVALAVVRDGHSVLYTSTPDVSGQLVPTADLGAADHVAIASAMRFGHREWHAITITDGTMLHHVLPRHPKPGNARPAPATVEAEVWAPADARTSHREP